MRFFYTILFLISAGFNSYGQNVLDSLTSKYDSARIFVETDFQKLSQKSDSISSNFENVGITERIDSISDVYSDKVNQTKQKINEEFKIDSVKAIYGSQINKINNAKNIIPVSEGDILSEPLDIKNFENDPTGFDYPSSLEIQKLPTEMVIPSNVGDFINENSRQLSDVSTFDEISKIERLAQLNDQLEQYKNYVRRENFENPDSLIEAKAETFIKELDAIPSEQIEFSDEFGKENMLNAYKEYQQELKGKAVTKAQEFFSEKPDFLEEHKKKISAYSKKLSLIKSRNKFSIRDKLIPGITTEISSNKKIDLSLSVHYHVSRYIIGVGYSYRFAFDNKNFRIMPENVYGGRGMVGYNIFKGIYLSSSFELLRSYKDYVVQTDEKQRAFIYQGFIGLVKRYQIKNFFTGRTEFHYNYTHNEDSPYANTYNIRIGFDLKLKKKRK